MARIVIENLFEKTLQASDYNKTVLEHFQDHYIDWMQACGRKGRCTTCKMIVKEGRENFGELTQAEMRYRQQGALKSDERLSCQSRITGDVRIVAPPEYQLPHLRYSDDEI